MACQGETLERSGTSKEHRTSRDHSAAASRFGADSRPFSSLPAPKLAGPAAPRSSQSRTRRRTAATKVQWPDSGACGPATAARCARPGGPPREARDRPLPCRRHRASGRKDSRLPQIARRKGGELPQ
ncbi:hypothetical protein PVAP13_9KG643400 [Panicum virgatum]|uniref:Uncharacterized protein n=1 Tax=Panicum virgatum TaxID=38727 RepID=A0A8T0NZJ5_PANVG|nr:hypothetical protein PVAP13_9KG643400 [Panicum virgatum]